MCFDHAWSDSLLHGISPKVVEPTNFGTSLISILMLHFQVNSKLNLSRSHCSMIYWCHITVNICCHIHASSNVFAANFLQRTILQYPGLPGNSVLWAHEARLPHMNATKPDSNFVGEALLPIDAQVILISTHLFYAFSCKSCMTPHSCHSCYLMKAAGMGDSDSWQKTYLN